MSKFRILFLEPQPCIRALKYAKALKYYLRGNVSLGFGYYGYSLNRLYGCGDEYFDRMVQLNPDDYDSGIRDLIDAFDPAIIHSHNAPNTMTLSAINVAEDIPVIHDVHEVLSVHNSGFNVEDNDETLVKYCEEEKRANEESDGRIYPTKSIKEYIQQNYNVDSEKDLVFNNYVSESMMPQHFKEKLSEREGGVHIVYIGCVTSVVEGSHYDLRGIFKGIASHGMHIHIYPSNNIITQSNHSYEKLAETSEFIHFYGNMNRKRLMKELTQYDFGWVGLNRVENGEHLRLVLPNKVMEYVGCGLPVLSFQHETIQRFVQKHEVGLIFQDLDALEELLVRSNLSGLRENVLNSRRGLALERHIPRVVDFYKQIVGGD